MRSKYLSEIFLKLTHSMEQNPSWKANRFAASQEIPAFYETRRLITVFTCARYLSVSWASSVQSIPPHPTSWSFILILASHLLLGPPSGLFTSDFPTKSPIRANAPRTSFFSILSPAQ
jgi:hypothetical protein